MSNFHAKKNRPSAATSFPNTSPLRPRNGQMPTFEEWTPDGTPKSNGLAAQLFSR